MSADALRARDTQPRGASQCAAAGAVVALAVLATSGSTLMSQQPPLTPRRW